VEIHATIADNILAGDILHDPYWMRTVDLVAIVVIGVLITLVVATQRSWLAFVVTSGLLLLALVYSVVLFRVWSLLFLPTRMIFTILLMFPVLTTIRYWQREQQERWIRGAFGAMVSRTVLDYMEENPQSVKLDSHKAKATVLFADIQDFTRITERLEPQKVSQLLNRFFSPLADAVMDRSGYVDKYMGDMIMAEWGVPYPVPDHPRLACLAALEQAELLRQMRPELKERFGFDIRMRIGINTGDVTAGNMGSKERFQYTVLGDAVNLAARLEPLNKVYGTTVIISETTRTQAGRAVEARLLDRVIVAGKTKPVYVYELMAMQGGLTFADKELIAEYQQALYAYWQMDWDNASRHARNALACRPEDGPSLRLSRLAARDHLMDVSVGDEVYVRSDGPVKWDQDFTTNIEAIH
jgi:adenylate cyclase